MRKAVGPDVSILVDYSQCLMPAEAVSRLRVLDDEARTPIQCGYAPAAFAQLHLTGLFIR